MNNEKRIKTIGYIMKLVRFVCAIALFYFGYLACSVGNLISEDQSLAQDYTFHIYLLAVGLAFMIATMIYILCSDITHKYILEKKTHDKT